MLITVAWTKGSQGKTTLACALAYHYQFNIITNDIDSSIDEYLPDDRVWKLDNDAKLPEIPKHVGVVFDGKAGIDEPIVIDAVKKADCVIIPCIYGIEEVKRAKRAIYQLAQYNTNIIIVWNMIEGKDRVEELCGVFRDEFPYPFFPIRKSAYIQEIINLPESVHEKAAKGKLQAYQMMDLLEQFEAIFNHLNLDD